MNTNQNTAKSITKIVPCPTCKKSVHWSATSQYRPFCSKRCQLIDLGDWAGENHRIPGKQDSIEDIE